MYMIGLPRGKFVLNLGGTRAMWSSKQGAIINIKLHWKSGILIKNTWVHRLAFNLTWWFDWHRS